MNSVEDYLLSVVAADQPSQGLVPATIRALLAGLSLVYGTVLDFYLALEKVGVRRRMHASVPVVSVGNLAVGGTGKTPFTIYLCDELIAHGLKPTVVSRGHGGRFAGSRIVSDGLGNVLGSAVECGDEPLAIARSLPSVPVIVGKDRRVSCTMAIAFAPDIIVLDDGFQYWQLFRNLDIVLLDARFPIGNGWALPRGLLRERKGHLKRASICVLTRCDDVHESRLSETITAVRKVIGDNPMFKSTHVPVCLVDVGTGGRISLDAVRGLNVFYFSGIANPEALGRMIEGKLGAKIAGNHHFRDHHAYTESDVESIIRESRMAGADAIITTEKDIVKWSVDRTDVTMPLYVLKIGINVDDSGSLMKRVLDAYSAGIGQ